MLCLFWLAFPAKLYCLKISLLGKTQGSSISFYSLCLFFPPSSLQTPEKKHSDSSRGRKRKADTYSESSQGKVDTWKTSTSYTVDINAVALTYIKCISYFGAGKTSTRGHKISDYFDVRFPSVSFRPKFPMCLCCNFLPQFKCSLQFQGGNGSSPVRGLPSARRSPQNSHSAPGSIVSKSQSATLNSDISLELICL